jgi:hypothetical protein
MYTDVTQWHGRGNSRDVPRYGLEDDMQGLEGFEARFAYGLDRWSC